MTINVDQALILQQSLSQNLVDAYTLTQQGDYVESLKILLSILKGKLDTIDTTQVIFYLVEIIEIIEEDPEMENKPILKVLKSCQYSESYTKIIYVMLNHFI
jgi:hypothetical protein